jgi:hypothetical protein
LTEPTAKFSPRKWIRTPNWPPAKWLAAAKWLVGVAGFGLLVVGAVTVVSTAGDSAAVPIVIAGAVLLICPFVIDRVDRVSVAAIRLDLRFTREVSALGAPKTAQILERTTLASFAESYAFIHQELRDAEFKGARIHLQDLLAERSAAIARREKFEAAEVRRLFSNGSPVMRVLVLGLMQGDPSLADAATLAGAIADGRSRNEQYQGLRLTVRCWHSLPRSGQEAIRIAINGAGIPASGNRRAQADAVLALPLC